MPHISTRSKGFTLIELLVVITIIVIAASIIIISGSGGLGTKLRTSERIVSAAAQGARGQAILKGATTRLIIYSDDPANNDAEKMGRFIGVVYLAEEVDSNGVVTATGWKAATQGVYLPQGIYFDPDGAPSTGTNPWPGDTMTLDYPRRTIGSNTDIDAGGGSEVYYYFEYNANGTITEYDNSWVVLRAGVLQPNSSNTGLELNFPEAGEDEANLKSALILRRTGTTTVVSDPDDINYYTP